MPLVSPRVPRKISCRNPEAVLHMILEAFRNGDSVLAFDMLEQMVDAHPTLAVSLLEMAHGMYNALPDKSRYHLYQARQFNFDIAPGARVLDIGSGNVPFPFATDQADIALEDNAYGRAGEAFQRLEGRRPAAN